MGQTALELEVLAFMAGKLDVNQAKQELLLIAATGVEKQGGKIIPDKIWNLY